MLDQVALWAGRSATWKNKRNEAVLTFPEAAVFPEPIERDAGKQRLKENFGP